MDSPTIAQVFEMSIVVARPSRIWTRLTEKLKLLDKLFILFYLILKINRASKCIKLYLKHRLEQHASADTQVLRKKSLFC